MKPPRILLLAAAAFCFTAAVQALGGPMPLQLATTAFTSGVTIPKKFTCDGPDLSPALTWSGSPSGTQSFGLIADDPDAPAGTWVHWVLYNMAAGKHELAEGVKRDEQLPDGAVQGRNDFRKIGYN